MRFGFNKIFFLLLTLLILTGFAASDHYTFPEMEVEMGETIDIFVECDGDEGACAGHWYSYDHELRVCGETAGTTSGTEHFGADSDYLFEDVNIPKDADCDPGSYTFQFIADDDTSNHDSSGGELEVIGDGAQFDHLEMALNYRDSLDSGQRHVMRGLGGTNDPNLDHGLEFDDYVDEDSESYVYWTGSTTSGTTKTAVLEPANPGTIVGPGDQMSDFVGDEWATMHEDVPDDYSGNFDSASFGALWGHTGGAESDSAIFDPTDWANFNRVADGEQGDFDEDPGRSDCDGDDYSCSYSYFEEDAWTETLQHGGTEDHDMHHWDPRGDILILEDGFWLCNEESDGARVELRNFDTDEYICNASGPDGGVWEEYFKCPDPGILLDDSGDLNYYEDLTGDNYEVEIGIGDDLCSYEHIGQLEYFEELDQYDVKHPVNRPDMDEYQKLEEPYAFKCDYNGNYDDVDITDFDLVGFEENRWIEYQGTDSEVDYEFVGDLYDEGRHAEARRHCVEVIDLIEEDHGDVDSFMELYDHEMPIAEYYHAAASMPQSDDKNAWREQDGEGRIYSNEGDVALERFMLDTDDVNEIGFIWNYDNSFQTYRADWLKHYRFQSLYEAQNNQGLVSNFFPYLQGYGFSSTDDCSEDVSYDMHCPDFYEPLEWDVDDYLESDSVEVDDLYGSEDSAWNVSNANGYLSDNVESYRDLAPTQRGDVESLDDTAFVNALDEQVFHGGFVPNCPDGYEFQFTADHNLVNDDRFNVNEGEEVWKCAEEGVSYQPEIYFPEVEELGSEPNQDINIGIFFPPSTFEHYEENDNVPNSRTHLDHEIGETNMRTATEAVEISEDVENTPRVRGMDVVCALGDENRVTPDNYQNIPEAEKFERTDIQVPRPPMNEVRGSLNTPYAGVKAPLPVTGEISGFPTTTGQYNTITCIWRYRYAGDFEEEWFSSGEARNLACDNPQNCDTGITNVNDEAQSRDWDTSDLPSQEVDSEITSDQVEEYQEAWQLTTQEEDRAIAEDEQDDVGTALDFGSDAIRNMLDSVLQFIG